MIVKIDEVVDDYDGKEAAKAGFTNTTPNLSTYIHHFNFNLLIISKPVVINCSTTNNQLNHYHYHYHY